MSVYLCNSVIINTPSGAQVVRSGELLSDTGVISAVQSAGGQTQPTANATVAAAAAIVADMRSRGQNEQYCDNIMIAALARSTPS